MIDVYDKQTRPARVQIRMELKDKKATVLIVVDRQ